MLVALRRLVSSFGPHNHQSSKCMIQTRILKVAFLLSGFLCALISPVISFTGFPCVKGCFENCFNSSGLGWVSM